MGASLVAISPETVESARETVADLELTFPVLSDSENRVAKDFGIVFKLPPDLRKLYEGMGVNLRERNGDDSYELPIPATYVICTDGIIKWSFVDPNHTNRAEPDDIIHVLEEITREPRPMYGEVGEQPSTEL